MRAIKTTTISILAIGLLAGSAVGVTAQEEEAADLSTPVYVTMTTGEPASIIDGAYDEDAEEVRGTVVEAVPVEASDPRLSGLAYAVINSNVDTSVDDYGVLDSRSIRIVNDDGAWAGTSTYVETGGRSGVEPPAIIREAGLLIGEGGYEGLVAFFTRDYLQGNQGEAVIFELSAPPVPDLPDVPAE